MVVYYKRSSKKSMGHQVEKTETPPVKSPHQRLQSHLERIQTYLEQDYRILPSVPTADMIKAACLKSNINGEQALIIYNAMIQAYDLGQEENQI